MGNFSMLPLDLVLNILVRLPVESVLECKLVSKPWKTIAQPPSFSKLHFNHLNHLASTVDSGKSCFIFYKHFSSTEYDEKQFSYTEYDESLNQFSGTRKMDLRPPFQNYQIIGSCNGLICFNPCNEYGALRSEPAYICNPITRESDRVDFVTGFGYIPSTNEYKVVRIYNSWNLADSEFIQVYTLGSGVGWRNVGKLEYDVIFVRQRGVFANGAIHWVDSEGSVISFDSADEEVHKLPPPPCLPQIPPFNVSLQVLGDFVCAYNSSFMDEDCGIWFLKKNTNNQDVFWSKEFSDFSHFGVTPITITKSGRLLYYNFSDKNVSNGEIESSGNYPKEEKEKEKKRSLNTYDLVADNYSLGKFEEWSTCKTGICRSLKVCTSGVLKRRRQCYFCSRGQKLKVVKPKLQY